MNEVVDAKLSMIESAHEFISELAQEIEEKEKEIAELKARLEEMQELEKWEKEICRVETLEKENAELKEKNKILQGKIDEFIYGEGDK